MHSPVAQAAPFPQGHRHAGGLVEMAREGTPAHGGPGGEHVDGVRFRHVFSQVVEQAIDMGVLGGSGNRLLNELRLPHPLDATGPGFVRKVPDQLSISRLQAFEIKLCYY